MKVGIFANKKKQLLSRTDGWERFCRHDLSEIKALIISSLALQLDSDCAMIISLEGKTQFSLVPKLHAAFDFQGKHLTQSLVSLLNPSVITWTWNRRSFFQVIILPEVVVPWWEAEVERSLEKESGKLQSFPGVPCLRGNVFYWQWIVNISQTRYL